MLLRASRDFARFEAVQVGRLLLASFREDALRCGRDRLDRAEGGSATTSVRGGLVGLMN